MDTMVKLYPDYIHTYYDKLELVKPLDIIKVTPKHKTPSIHYLNINDSFYFNKNLRSVHQQIKYNSIKKYTI